MRNQKSGGIHIDGTSGEAVANRPAARVDVMPDLRETGSSPVSSDDVFDVIAMIDRQIDLAQIDADHPDQHETRRWIKVMRHCNDVLALHAAELRREMGSPNKRQPGSNAEISQMRSQRSHE